MNLLVIDTATEACSVALDVNGQVYSQFDVCPQQHSQRILPMIDQVLSEAGVTLTDLDYLGFGRGPGSFTGVRIATGIIQGLALGTELKVVGVSTLAAMAQQLISLNGTAIKTTQTLAVAIDARMSEVYFAQFRMDNGMPILLGDEQVLSPEYARSLLISDQAIFAAGTGWDAYPKLSSELTISNEPSVLYPDAKFMLSLAKHAIQNGLVSDVEDITPVYLRDKVTWKKLPGREL